MEFAPRGLVRLVVESLAYGGDAVARMPAEAGEDTGRVVFLDSGAPGDQVEARIVEAKARFARAEVTRVVAAGPERVAALCPLVGRCGGCQWQEVTLAAQRAAKHAIVTRALGRLGVEVRPIVAATDAFGYRSRARFTVGADGAIGLQARRSHEVVDVPACPLLEPALNAALVEIRGAGPVRWPAGATISLLAGGHGQAHVSIAGLGAGGDVASLHALAGRGAIAGISVDGQLTGAPTIDTSDTSDTSHTSDATAGGEPPFFGAASGFAQASRAGNRALRRIVAAELGRDAAPRRVLELYAGDGNFTRDVARLADEVLAVEGDRAACARLPENVSGPARVQVICEPVEQAARRLAHEGASFDALLIDPPRAGAAAILAYLPPLAPRLVYVSCDPMTLARDARTLAAAGMRPLHATPIDLMPHTFHVEMVCVFERAG